MTRRVADAIDAALKRDTYEVFLDDHGRLRWRDSRNGQDIIWSHEPQTSFFQRFAAGLMRFLPIRSQL
jgi:putative cardiolipin synthase